MPDPLMTLPTDRQISDFFRDKAKGTGWVDTLKIRYRPLICPFALLLRQAEGHDSIYDIGCGSGQFCGLALRFTDAQRVEGIEIDQRLVANAQRVAAASDHGGKQVRFSVYDGANIPDAIGSYGLVYMIDVLHHIPPAIQEGILNQVYQKMRPGAVLILKDIDASSPLVIFNRMHDIVFAGAPGREWGMMQAEESCSRIGFRQEAAERVRMLLYPHYMLRLRKPAA